MRPLRLSPEQIDQLTDTGKLEIGDAQLVWRGKDEQDWSDLVVHAPPLYIQEKIHPKAIIDDLKRHTEDRQEEVSGTFDLFGDFNGINAEAKTEFYKHDQNWSNRMILGDSLQVMASLAEREGLRGKVQCIYFDPPYGIKIQFQLAGFYSLSRCEGRQARSNHPGAGTGQSFQRYVGRWYPFLPNLPPRSLHSYARPSN